MSTNERTPNDEPERDAWLAEALRHAPDADAAPPSALSDMILRQARAAVKTPIDMAVPRARAGARTSGWAAAWSWLARPSVAAGFASVMVATIVGVIWWDQPLDQTIQRPPPASTVSRDATPRPREDAAVATSGPATSSAPLNEPAAAAAAAAVPRSKNESSPSRKAATQDKTTALDREDALSKAAPQRSQQVAADSALDKARPPGERREAKVAQSRADVAIEAAPAPPATSVARDAGAAPASSFAAAPAPSLAKPAPAQVAPAPAPSFAATPAQPDSSRRTRELGSTSASTSASASASASAFGSARASASSLPTSPDAVIASITREPQRWTWRRSAGSLPVTESLVAWLRQLADTTRAASLPTIDAPPAARPLLLYRDGTLAATVIVDAEAAWFIPAAQSAVRTALAPEMAATLQRSLDLAAP